MLYPWIAIFDPVAFADSPPWDPVVMSDGCSVPEFAEEVLPELTRIKEIGHECCVSHDRVYYLGGPEEPKRSLADAAFRDCMLAKLDQEDPDLRQWAFIAWVAVRIGGGPDTCEPYRWGFGEDWKMEDGAPVYRPKPCGNASR